MKEKIRLLLKHGRLELSSLTSFLGFLPEKRPQARLLPSGHADTESALWDVDSQLQGGG